MPKFVKIGRISDLPLEGEAKEFDCQGKTLCIARFNGEISAMDNVCYHRGGPLGQGVVIDAKIICPWHGWEFDLKTGQAVHGKDMGVAVYPIRLEGDDVLVEI